MPIAASISHEAATLVAPVSDTSPSGSNPASDENYQDLRRELDKLQSPTGEGVRWPQVVALGVDILAYVAKDLLVASYIALGLYHTRGLHGLAVGVVTVDRLLEQHWATMFPPLAHPEGRGTALRWLVEHGAAALANHTVRPGDQPAVESLVAVTSVLRGRTRELLGEHAPSFEEWADALAQLRQALPAPEPGSEPEPPPAPMLSAPPDPPPVIKDLSSWAFDPAADPRLAAWMAPILGPSPADDDASAGERPPLIAEVATLQSPSDDAVDGSRALTLDDALLRAQDQPGDQAPPLRFISQSDDPLAAPATPPAPDPGDSPVAPQARPAEPAPGTAQVGTALAVPVSNAFASAPVPEARPYVHVPEDMSSAHVPEAGSSTTVPKDSVSPPISEAGSSTPVPEDRASAPISEDSVSTLVPEAGSSTPVPEAGASTPVPEDSASTPVPEAGASTPVPEDSASTPVSEAGASTPVSEDSASTPVSEAGDFTPVPAAISYAPVAAAFASTPVPEARASAPVSEVIPSPPVPAAISAPAPEAIPSPPVAAPPADAATPATVDRFLRTTGEELVKLGGALRRAHSADPLAYRLLRSGLWIDIVAAPPSQPDGGTEIPGLAERDLSRLVALQSGERWAELLEACESLLPLHRLALDLQRFTTEALAHLPGHEACIRAVIAELAALLLRLPTLQRLKDRDGAPLADPTTSAWIDEHAPTGTASAPIAAIVPSTPTPTAPPTASDAEPLQALLAAGKRDEALRLGALQIQQAGDGRQRFLRRLELADLMQGANEGGLARALYTGLVTEVDGQRIDLWEPQLAVRCFEGLARSLPWAQPAERAAVDMVIARLAALDPARAHALARG